MLLETLLPRLLLEPRESLSSKSDSSEFSELASDGDPGEILDRDREMKDFLDLRLGDGDVAFDLRLDLTLLVGLCGRERDPG